MKFDIIQIISAGIMVEVGIFKQLRQKKKKFLFSLNLYGQLL